jgi:pimeloyl-ACP methyl ester carboxylesterase
MDTRGDGGAVDDVFVNGAGRRAGGRPGRQNRLRSGERSQDVLRDPRRRERQNSAAGPASRRRIDHRHFLRKGPAFLREDPAGDRLRAAGHGHTADVVDRPYGFEQSADDAAALLRHLRLERADFFGYSNGGSIALQIAIRHPGLARKLVVASAMFKRDGLYPEFWESMKHATLEGMPVELKEAYLKVAPHPEQLPTFHDTCARRMLEFKDWRAEDIRSITAPTMVMVADGDIVRPEHAVEMFRLLPHGQLAVLPGTDHMTLVTRADWQVSMIEAFLDEREVR